ncbi:unnamed protein product [Paramecium primaurelia]|uniref:Tubulin folding cofactor B n=1 Tax=Paramecium primaurelia TaxID=5886 RepID=A0A8S1P647_PARPR|nr:unnamed protein product [Paramecium primaurelia]
MIAEPLAYDSTVKLTLTHNISTNKMIDIRFDLMQTIGSIKESIEKRYGSDPKFMQLQLKDKQGNFITYMNDDVKFLGTYGAKDGYEVHIIDNNPNSVLNGLEDVNKVQKYTISDEDYDKLPVNMRKFKQQVLQQQAAGGNLGQNKPEINDNFQEAEALQIAIGSRCQILQGERRGTVRYVGQVPQMGLGYFIGIELDEPTGTNNGNIQGFQYFQCPQKFGIFVRPNELIVGDYPVLDLDEI